MSLSNSENNKMTEKDLCVYCWQETQYFVDTHIDMRIGYVEGSGQLCGKCNERIYGQKDNPSL